MQASRDTSQGYVARSGRRSSSQAAVLPGPAVLLAVPGPDPHRVGVRPGGRRAVRRVHRRRRPAVRHPLRGARQGRPLPAPVSAPTEDGQEAQGVGAGGLARLPIVPDPTVKTLRIVDKSARGRRQEGRLRPPAGPDGKAAIESRSRARASTPWPRRPRRSRSSTPPPSAWLADLLPSRPLRLPSLDHGWPSSSRRSCGAPSGTPTSTSWVTPPTGPCWPCGCGPTTTCCAPRWRSLPRPAPATS